MTDETKNEKTRAKEGDHIYERKRRRTISAKTPNKDIAEEPHSAKRSKSVSYHTSTQTLKAGRKHVMQNMDDPNANSDDDFMPINKKVQLQGKERATSKSSKNELGDDLQLVPSHGKPKPKKQHKPQLRYKGFETRTTPNTLTEAVMSLSNQQKIAVASMGFEGILHLRITKVYTQFAKWLLESFDSKTCMLKTKRGDAEILPMDVNYMLGLPMGGRPIKVPLRTIPHEHLVQTFRRQYGGAFDNSVSCKDISKTIQSSKEANDCFKLNFLVLFYSTVVDSTKSVKSNQRILNAIEGLDDISALNWCEFVIDRLCHTKDEWDKDKFQPYTGPIPFLMAMYLDSFQDRFVQVERTLPAIISTNDEVIENRIKSEKRQGEFGLHVTLLNRKQPRR